MQVTPFFMMVMPLLSVTDTVSLYSSFFFLLFQILILFYQFFTSAFSILFYISDISVCTWLLTPSPPAVESSDGARDSSKTTSLDDDDGAHVPSVFFFFFCNECYHVVVKYIFIVSSINYLQTKHY